MPGSGTVLDLDFTANPKQGWAKKTLVSTYGGSAKGLFAIGTRADGYLDPSVHPPLGLLTSTRAPGVDLLGLPNGNFEDGLGGWTVSTSGGGAVTIDTAQAVTGKNAVLLTTTANSDVASLFYGLNIPAGEAIPLSFQFRGRIKSGSPVFRAVVYCRDATGANLSTGGVNVPTLNGAWNSTGMAEIGCMFLPPTGTRYVLLQLDTYNTTGAAWLDEVRYARRPIRTSQVLKAARTQLVANGGTLSAFLADFTGGKDDTDGTFEAANIEPEASVGGVLYGALNSYLTAATTASPPGLGLSAAAATSALTTIWANACNVQF